MRSYLLLCVVFLCLVGCAEEPESESSNADIEKEPREQESLVEPKELVWHWEDEFTPDQKEKVQVWVDSVWNGITRYYGPYPLQVHIFMHASPGSKSAIPWARTQRKRGEQGVHFHIDPDASLDALLSDWTAAHELSHLALPFLGRDNMWFSEGFATCLQNELQVEIGAWTRDSADNYVQSKMVKIEPLYQLDTNFVAVANRLRYQGDYWALYWGGATFFMEADRRLKAKGSSLQTVLQDFVACCRFTERDLEILIVRLDSVSGTSVFSDLYVQYTQEKARDVNIRGLIY